jgi:hypothetical protein
VETGETLKKPKSSKYAILSEMAKLESFMLDRDCFLIPLTGKRRGAPPSKGPPANKKPKV